MADEAVLRMRRSRAHARGDHSLCRGRCERRPDAVLAAVRAELAAAGQLDSFLGALALHLAEAVDQCGQAAGLPGLVRELRETMGAVRESVPRPGRLAELRAARR